jgi:hypothetical protein
VVVSASRISSFCRSCFFLQDLRRRSMVPTVHYRNPGLCRVPAALPSAFYHALDKEDFAQRRTRQSPALGKELVYRVHDTRHRETLGKAVFAERRTLGKDGSRQRAVSGHLQLTTVSLCRGPKAGTRQSRFFAECQISGTRQRGSLPSVFCGHSTKHIFIFLFWPPNFLWYVPTLCRPTCTILGQL